MSSMIQRLFYFLLLSFVTLCADEHKMIYMIATPRSHSTVFLRMMDHRGDFAVYNDPLIALYDYTNYRDLTKDWFNNHALYDCDKIKERVLNSLKEKNVFVHDMSFSVHELLIKDVDFIRNPRVHFVIFAGNPHSTLISFYQKIGKRVEDISGLVGFRQLYEIFQIVKKESPNPVKVIFSDELCKNPQRVIEAFCAQYQLPFDDKHLEWEPYDSSFTGEKEWHEIKAPDTLMHWHYDAIFSTGFPSPMKYEINENNEPTFSEIENLREKEKLTQAFFFNIEYYKKLQLEKSFHLLP